MVCQWVENCTRNKADQESCGKEEASVRSKSPDSRRKPVCVCSSSHWLQPRVKGEETNGRIVRLWLQS